MAPLKVDPSLPDWLRDRFKDSLERYGHLNSLEMMIEIGRVLEAKEANDGLTKASGFWHPRSRDTVLTNELRGFTKAATTITQFHVDTDVAIRHAACAYLKIGCN